MTSTFTKKVALPLLVLAIVLTLTGVASAQMGKGWFEVDDLRVMGRADIAGESTFRDTVTIKDNVTLTGTVSAASLLISGNGDVTGNFEVTDHLLAQAELYMIPPANLTVTDNGIITPTAAVMVLTAAGTVASSLAPAGDGQFLILVNNANQTITISETSTARIAGDFAMGQYDVLTLIGEGVTWHEMARSNN